SSEDPATDPAAAEGAGAAWHAAGAPVSRGRTAVMLAALVIIAIGGTLVEDSGNSWATLYLARDLGAPATIAATGYIGLVAAQFIGRLIGDGLVDRFGQRAVARTGGVIIAIGMAAALAVPTVPGTIIGFVL